MTAIDRDIVAEATAIIDDELARVHLRHALACTATTLLLAVAAVFMVLGFAHRDPWLYSAGVATFGVTLMLAKRVTTELA